MGKEDLNMEIRGTQTVTSLDAGAKATQIMKKTATYEISGENPYAYRKTQMETRKVRVIIKITIFN